MTYLAKNAVLFALGLALAAGIAGQALAQLPPIPGAFTPLVGSGGVYELRRGDRVSTWTFAYVGKEKIQGEDAYWTERRQPEKGGEKVTKQLVVFRSGQPEVKRVIMQSPGQPPMEMPAELTGALSKSLGGGGLGELEREGRKAVKVGTESVTVPAGTFLSDHYRLSAGTEVSDSWVPVKGPPYGVVKSTRGDSVMVLVKVLQNETSHVQGQPEPFRSRSRRSAPGN